MQQDPETPYFDLNESLSHERKLQIERDVLARLETLKAFAATAKFEPVKNGDYQLDNAKSFTDELYHLHYAGNQGALFHLYNSLVSTLPNQVEWALDVLLVVSHQKSQATQSLMDELPALFSTLVSALDFPAFNLNKSIHLPQPNSNLAQPNNKFRLQAPGLLTSSSLETLTRVSRNTKILTILCNILSIRKIVAGSTQRHKSITTFCSFLSTCILDPSQYVLVVRIISHISFGLNISKFEHADTVSLFQQMVSHILNESNRKILVWCFCTIENLCLKPENKIYLQQNDIEALHSDEFIARLRSFLVSNEALLIHGALKVFYAITSISALICESVLSVPVDIVRLLCDLLKVDFSYLQQQQQQQSEYSLDLQAFRGLNAVVYNSTYDGSDGSDRRFVMKYDAQGSLQQGLNTQSQRDKLLPRHEAMSSSIQVMAAITLRHFSQHPAGRVALAPYVAELFEHSMLHYEAASVICDTLRNLS